MPFATSPGQGRMVATGFPAFGIQSVDGGRWALLGKQAMLTHISPLLPRESGTKGGICSASSSREDTTGYKSWEGHPAHSFGYASVPCPLKLPLRGLGRAGGWCGEASSSLSQAPAVGWGSWRGMSVLARSFTVPEGFSLGCWVRALICFLIQIVNCLILSAPGVEAFNCNAKKLCL